MSMGRNAGGSRPVMILCAVLCAWLGCMQPDPDVQVSGSGTELGNVMGILVDSERQAIAGVEVMLYPLDGDSSRILKTTTDAQGAFAFKVEDGAFRLLALDGTGNGVSVDSLFPSPRDTIDLQETALAPLGGIRGFVKADRTSPTGPNLRLIGTPFDTTYPGNAEFIWEGIPAGNYWLEVYQWGGMAAGLPTRRIAVAVVSGAVTALPDTLDLTATELELSSEDLPYLLVNPVRGANGLEPDSIFWRMNGMRIENPASREALAGHITVTEAMLDSSRVNNLELLARIGGAFHVAHTWRITWNRSPRLPAKWAYQAVRALILALDPDGRAAARRPGAGNGNPQVGTFRVLERSRLSRESLEFWEWPAEAGGDSLVPGEIQAAVYHPRPHSRRGCYGGSEVLLPLPYFPGDTVTFFLLPDSLLGAVAFRLRDDERVQDLDRIGYFARADWPLGESFFLHHKELELLTSLRPDGLHIAWPRIFMFRGSQPGCQSTFRRFHLDSLGRTRELLACPSGIDPSRLLLHFRADFDRGIDADTLPTSGVYVYVDSTGLGMAGSPDSSRRFQLDEGALQELKTLLSGFPDPVPADWDQGDVKATWQEGAKEAARYLVSDQRGALHFRENLSAAPAKADLFSRVELWLRSRNLL